MFESMHRRPRVGGGEQDGLSHNAKKYYRWRSGERSEIKHLHNRRVRRSVRRDIKQEDV